VFDWQWSQDELKDYILTSLAGSPLDHLQQAARSGEASPLYPIERITPIRHRLNHRNVREPAINPAEQPAENKPTSYSVSLRSLDAVLHFIKPWRHVAGDGSIFKRPTPLNKTPRQPPNRNHSFARGRGPVSPSPSSGGPSPQPYHNRPIPRHATHMIDEDAADDQEAENQQLEREGEDEPASSSAGQPVLCRTLALWPGPTHHWRWLV